MNGKSLLVVLLILCACFLVTRPFAQAPEKTETTTDLVAPPRAVLHVEVETNWAWFWQKTKGHAWVTMGKEDTTRVKVGKLCIRLQAHDTKDSCAANADEIILSERKRGVQIAKKTAIVTAWAESPNLDTAFVKMEP